MSAVALAVGPDPEDFGRLATGFQNAVSGGITRMGGTIAYVAPDHILGIFGFPAAHEDDAERAVIAGLDAVAAVGQILSPKRQPLHLRVGIATGFALTNQQQTLGAPATLATALSSLTPMDSVTVTANTRRLLGANFRCDGLERYVLVGLAEPVDTYRVRARRVLASRFKARQPSSSLRLVNRERELQLLRMLWERAKQRKGQVAAIIGEAGIGKSHLCEFFLEQVSEPHLTLRYQCSSHHLNDPFYPIISQIEHSMGLRKIYEPELKFKKLQDVLVETVAATREDVRHYANLLSIAAKQRPDALRQTTPQRQKDLLMTALVRNLQKLAERRFLIIVVADAHWIDPSSLELLNRIIFAIASAQIFLIVKFRPEFMPPWLGELHVTTIQLGRLTHDQGTAIISQLTGDTKLDRDIQAEIIDKADGVPLFIEEITKSVLESDLLEEIDGHYVVRGGLEPLSVPRSIMASLTARIDRLGPAKEIAQVASAIGRVFSHGLLAAVAAKSADALQAALYQLIAAELIFVKEKTPEIVYAFKHALLREAIYASTVRSKRQLLHRRIATILEGRFPDFRETQPSLLAHHLAEAGLVLPAVEYLQKAGRRSLERSANAEAIGQLTRALELMQSDSDGAQDKALQFDLEATLSQSLIARYGYAASETRNGLLRARALFDHATDEAQKFSVLYGIWASNYVGGEILKQQGAAAEFLKEAVETSNDALKCMGQRIAGTTELTVGAFKSAVIHLNQARALYDPSRHGGYRHQYGQDIGASTLCYLGLALWHVGLVDQASKVASSAVALAEQLSHPHTLVYTLCHARGLMDILRKRPEDMHVYAALVDSLCQENGFAHWANFGTILNGWRATGRGEADLGLTLIRDGRTAWQKGGAQLWLPLFLLLEAQASLEAGKPEGALTAVEEAISICEGGGESWALAEVLRTKASILQSRKATLSEIEATLLNSIDVARRQGALCWELRASCQLSSLWRRRGKSTEALNLLRPIYHQFTEGFEMDELRQSHKLLCQLEEAVH